MNDDNLVILLLVVLGIAALIFIPKIREGNRQRQIERELFETEKQDHYVQLKKRSNQRTPGYIQDAIREFMDKHGAEVRSGRFDENAISPLTYYGYRVGKARGRSGSERKKILEVVLFKSLPDIFPLAYRSKWGAPGSPERLIKICNHITMLADRRAARLNYEVAVAEWRHDSSWCSSNFKEEVRNYRRFSLV